MSLALEWECERRKKGERGRGGEERGEERGEEKEREGGGGERGKKVERICGVRWAE